MDILSNVLRVIRLEGAVFFTAELSSPWSILSPPSKQLAPVLMPSAECFTLFHVVAEGNCWFGVEGDDPVRMEAGDVAVFPQGDQHLMTSELDAKPVPAFEVLPQWPHVDGARLVQGGGGETTKLICGFLRCEQKFGPLFDTLPALLWVKNRGGKITVEPTGGTRKMSEATIPVDAGAWLATTLRFMITEANSMRPGNDAMLARLTELFFVEVLRGYMQRLPANQTGFLAGLKDSHVSKALELLHGEPEREWTVEELAKAVGISRSTLAERFTDLLGASPIRYLSSWRMQIAKQLLSTSDLTLQEVAAQVGYESEYAFNRAFKRFVGEPPAKWRRGTMISPGESAAG